MSLALKLYLIIEFCAGGGNDGHMGIILCIKDAEQCSLMCSFIVLLYIYYHKNHNVFTAEL